MASELYVVPLDSATVREHRYDSPCHDHIELPLATLVAPEDLDDAMRKDYFHFVAYWQARES